MARSSAGPPTHLPHPLPERLVDLCNAGRWTREEFGPSLAAFDLEPLPAHAGLEFLNPRQMLATLAESRLVNPLIRFAYGMPVVQIPGCPVPRRKLDVRKGLPLIDIDGEPFVWLDYRFGAVPRVIGLTDAGQLVPFLPAFGPRPQWRSLASSFDEFISICEAAREPTTAPPCDGT